VADSTLTFDRGYKLRLYAKAGVPEVWIVDVQSERVEIYRDPVDQRYTSVHVADKSDSIAPAAFPDAAIHVGELFG
ncbi:MAG TPA: Uma2 family endonuclease, partial [Rhodothermales bacterium]